MKIFGYDIRKEKRGIVIGPTSSTGLPFSGLSLTLSADMAMKLSAVYRCVEVRSDSIATMPYDIFVRRKDEWIKDDNHLAYSILNIEPNKSCSAYTFFKALTAQHDLNGNGYARIHRDEVGNPIQLELLTGLVTMYIRSDMSVYYLYINPYSNQEFFIDGEDMIHIKNFSYDGLMGVSTLTHASNITGLAASADGQAKGYYSNGVNMNGIVSVPGKITKDKATELKTDWAASVAYNSTTGIGGGVVVLEGGAVYTPIQVNPKDAQMLETRAFNVLDICRFFGVSPIKAFDVTSATYANVESYQLGFITDTISPLARKIDNEINRKLLRPSQRGRTRVELRIKFLLSSDLKTQADYYSKMFNIGAYSPNDICKEINVKGYELGDKRYVQANLVEIGKEPTPAQNKNVNTIADDKEV